MIRLARLIIVLFIAVAILLPISLALGPYLGAVGQTIQRQPHGMVQAPAVRLATSVAATSYAVIFGQTGLSPGTWWTVVLNGVARTTQGGDPGIAFSEPNGTFSFQTSASGYTADPPSGSLDVDGQSITEMILFTLPGGPFIVTFEESGLPSATAWSATLNGDQQSSTAASILFTGVSNGTYAFATSTSSLSWQTTEQESTVVVAGSNPVVLVKFEYAYRATFEAVGLPAGVQWYVNLTGNLSTPASHDVPATVPRTVTYFFAGGAPALVVALSNGSYTYTVTSNSLTWVPPTTHHSLTVDGASPATQSVLPLASILPPTTAGQSWTWLVALAVVVAVVLVGSLGYRTYALRPAPSTGPDAADELYASYDLPTEVDPATADGNPDPLDDIF